jgi:hypothetical protein
MYPNPRLSPSKHSSARSESWHRRVHGEPALAHVLDDPIIALLMRRDGVTSEALRAVIAQAQAV